MFNKSADLRRFCFILLCFPLDKKSKICYNISGSDEEPPLPPHVSHFDPRYSTKWVDKQQTRTRRIREKASSGRRHGDRRADTGHLCLQLSEGHQRHNSHRGETSARREGAVTAARHKWQH